MANWKFVFDQQFLIFFLPQTTSRAGWQSPQDNPVSPKSDNYPYRHTVKSMSSPKHMIRNSSYTLETNSSNTYHQQLQSNHQNYNHHNCNPQSYQQYSKSADCKHRNTFKNCDSHHKRKDSGDKRHLMTIPNSVGASCKPISSSTTPASSSTSNEMLEQHNYQAHPQQQQQKQQPQENMNGKFDRCTMNYHGLSKSGGGGSNIKANMNENENQSLTKNNVQNGDCMEATSVSNQFLYESDIPRGGREYQQQTIDITHCRDKSSQQYNVQKIDENRYGKILHRVNGGGGCGGGGVGGGGNVNGKDIVPSIHYSNNYDQYNANTIQYQPIRCDNNVASKTMTAITHNNCTNNNNGQNSNHTNLYSNANGNHSSYNGQSTNVNNVVVGVGAASGGGGAIKTANCAGMLAVTNPVRRPINETNRNMLRTSRYSAAAAAAVAAATNNSTHLVAPGNHQLAHMINSLSSPESAYSTGYSTDGTSPGKHVDFNVLYKHLFCIGLLSVFAYTVFLQLVVHKGHLCMHIHTLLK